MTEADIRNDPPKNRLRMLRAARLAAVVSGLLLTPGTLCAQSQQLPPGNPTTGKQLFSGERRFQNGGPACAACHSIAGLPFPNGGVIGPDLTGEYTKLGPEGMAATLETLFFPTMLPLFANHLLTPQEQADLGAFILSVNSRPPPPGYTPVFALLALAGLLVLLAAMAIIWRSRIADGAKVFYDKGCEFCHLVSGYGGLRGPDLTYAGDRMTAQQMSTRIFSGAANMPSYTGNLTPDQLKSLLTFLESRQRTRPTPP